MEPIQPQQIEPNHQDPPPGIIGSVVHPQSVSAGPTPDAQPPLPIHDTKNRRRLGRKKVIILAAVLALLIGGGAAAYFGYYIPNQPENLWKTALANTGKGYDKLAQYSAQQKNIKGISVNGSFKLTGTTSADGTLSGKSDGTNSQFTGSISVSGLKLSLDFLTIKSTTNTPDAYIKVDGLQGLGQLLGGDPQSIINGINGQWYLIDHTLFDQYTKSVGTGTSFTSGDLNASISAIGGPTKKYIFTDNQQNMAVVIKQKIGKETQDGRSVYHYKVGFNKANLKAYNNELCDALKNTKLFTLLLGSNDPTKAMTQCKDTSDLNNINEAATADAWVDTNTKLVHKIRIYSSQKDTNNYFDIGQDYSGGNSFPLTFGFQSKSGTDTTTGSLKLTLDTSSNNLTVKGNLNGGGSSSVSGSLDLTVSANNLPVKVDKPQNAKSLLQLLNDLGLSQLLQSGTSSLTPQLQ